MQRIQQAYLYVLFWVSPLASLYYSILSFKYAYARWILILTISFLGFNLIGEGDLSRYEQFFYSHGNETYKNLFENLINLKEGKFYVAFLSLFTSKIFPSHFFFMAILFFIYGYFLVHLIYEFYELLEEKLTRFELFFFWAFALYFSIRGTLSLPFYSGALYFMYMLIKYLKTDKFYWLVLAVFCPLFHMGLALGLIVLPIYYFVRNRVFINWAILVVFFILGKTSFNQYLEKFASKNEGTLIEQKYNTYASESGKQRLDERYEMGEANSNWKLKILDNARDLIWFCIPIGLIYLFFKKKDFEEDDFLYSLFNLTILLWSIVLLLTNVSNGIRFNIIFTFTGFGLFFMLYHRYYISKFFEIFSYFLTGLGLVFGIMSIVAYFRLIGLTFITSDFPIQTIRYLLYPHESTPQ